MYIIYISQWNQLAKYISATSLLAYTIQLMSRLPLQIELSL